MAALPTDLRNKLERTIIAARDVAEAGAKAALEALAVHHYEPFPHQKPEPRKLRVQLRAHARQLGDTQNAKGELSLGHLVRECAYEHWHRMLFARFLAECDLLIEPDSGMAINLAEAQELAKAAKVDLWTFASRCAQKMLPQIFRPDDPLLQVSLANEHRVKLERLLADLSPTTFKADDSLGWVYQFWQSAEKDRVNASGEKITGDTLPAVTQLFTEDYMVLFLLHNTIGAWHAGKVLAANPTLAESATSEESLRQAMALKTGGGYSFDFLRFVRGSPSSPSPGTPGEGRGEGIWRPAAGTFDGWPKTAAQLKMLDPCCGSGHFLVAGFELLVRQRMTEEGLDVVHAVDAVLADNLFGLELDARCTQIAAFNLAMAAWKLTGYRPLPPLNIACTGTAPQATVDQWLKLTEPAVARAPLRDRDPVRLALRGLHSLFGDAPTLGSLIDPNRVSMIGAADWETVEPYLVSAMQAEADAEDHERAVAAASIAIAAKLLADDYTLVITNVPYLGRGKQNDILSDHLQEHYSEGKADLATAFVARCQGLCAKNCPTALVTPQNWLFLTTYTKLRETLLRRRQWNIVARLGPGAFEMIGGHVVNVALLILSATTPGGDHLMTGIDVSDAKQTEEKARELVDTPLTSVPQAEFLRDADFRISAEAPSKVPPLSDLAISVLGLGTGDAPHYAHCFWEHQSQLANWERMQTAAPNELGLGGREHVVAWDATTKRVYGMTKEERIQGKMQDYRGKAAWGRDGVLVSLISTLKTSPYVGDLFDKSVAAVVPNCMADATAIRAYCCSPDFAQEVRKLDQKVMVTNATLLKVPFDRARWQKVAAQKYPNGLPEPESDEPTQWLFHGRPEASIAPLQVAVARLLGYRWPAEIDDKMRLSQRARELAKRCDELLKFAVADGIVCIPSVRREESAADRLLTLLSACGIKPDRNLDEWLRNEFFREHCELFHQRPFIWHIWDGRKRDGFHALVNYHKLCEVKGKGRRLLENLTYAYLGEWITRQKDGVKRGEDGAEDRLAAALELQNRLKAIIAGEPPFDIFVRWKPLAEQPIGWEPDINDGVRVNIRPFLASDIPGGNKGAGILRYKPNIKWDKDRGKEPERKKAEYPWFWGWDQRTEDFPGGKVFDGNRWNDCHYTIDVKRAARDAAKEGGR